MMKYEIGSVVTGCVTGIEKYGIFVGLDEFYSGLIHISEISNDFVKNVSDYVNIGETIKVRILECDDDECHVKLSIKNLDYRITKKKTHRIKETSTGFYNLGLKLDEWIKEKEAEISINLE